MSTQTVKIPKLKFSIQLSQLLLNLLLNSTKKGELFLKKMIRLVYENIQFLRHFDYSKKNLTNHFIEKASAFFGIEWVEDRPVSDPKTVISKRKKSIKSTLQELVRSLSNSKNQPQGVKILKKNNRNFFRSPA